MGRVMRSAGIAVACATLLVVGAPPAHACTLAIPAVTANKSTVPAGGTVHLTGGGQFYEVIPVEERPSTTTTTLQGGGTIAECPPTRPASSFDVFLNRFHPEDQLIHSDVILHVEGSTLDHDVVIPASTAPGEVTLSATNAGGVTITVTRGGRLPATGSQQWSSTAVAALLLSLGGWLLGVRRLQQVG